MKSAKNMMKFIQNCLSGNPGARRPGSQRRNNFSGGEAMEQRLLLTADLNNVLFTPIVLENLQQNALVDSYFVRFETAQDTDQLQLLTEAASVTASPFVANGYTFEFDDGMTVQNSANLFAALPDFDYLHPNILQTPERRVAPNDPLYTDQWHLNNTGQGGSVVGIDINVESVWDNYTGQGVTIGIVDDGLEYTHEDIAPNANTTIDFDYRAGDNDPIPEAGDFHGTAVGGLSSAKGNNGIGVSGSAWDAELVGLRLIGGPLGDGTIAQALTHELNIIDIYNNSWGPPDNGRLQFIGPQALAALEQAATTGRNGLGNIHTWAAGNGGDLTNDNVNYDPYANSRFTIAVGALGNNGVRAQYSDPGAAIFVVAPSGTVGFGGTLDLSTTDITGAGGYDATNYTDTFNGTSASTPVVSGVIALMLEANPNLTYRDVTNILARTSERVDQGNADWIQNGAGIWVNHEYGFGNIDAAAAVAAALSEPLVGDEESFSTGVISVNQAIPDAGGGSVSRTVAVSNANAIDSLEYVEVAFTAAHARAGDLEIVLTSPSGTQSILAETRTDNTNGYNSFLFSTVRNWGESSAGDWTITVTDGTGGITGSLTSFELNFYGTSNQFVTITESGGNTRVSDFGGVVDSFEVALSTQPTANVVLSVTSTDLTEVIASPQTLTFTTANWNIPQVVSVQGVSDLQPDGTQTTDVIISDGVESAIVSVTSTDDDGTVPGKPVVTGPDPFDSSNTPIFTWTPGIRSNSFNLTVIDLQTGATVQQATNIAANQFAFASPFPDGLYQATVQAVNTIGQAGEVSDPWVFNIGEPIVPGQPRITAPITGSVLNTNQPTIQWTAQPGAFEYEVYFLTNGTITRFRTAGVNVGNGELAYLPTTPFDEGVTSVWVRGFNFFGTAGEWSTAVRFTVDAFGIPNIPRLTAPLLSVTSNAFPTFEWTGGGPNASTYQLWVAELRDGTGTPQVPAIYDRVIHLTDFNELNYSHFRALNEKTHRAWVRAFNAAGEASRWSSFVEFSVSVPTPEAPVVTPIANTQDTTPRITWDAGTPTPGTTYRLWVNNLSTGANRIIDVSGLESTSYTPVNDVEQGRLAVWVQATNAVGETGPWSDRVIVNVDILPPPTTQVTGPVAALNAESSVVMSEFPQFSWLPSFNAVRYELWVNHDDTGTSRVINEKAVVGLSFTPSLALPQGNFSAWVRGVNIANEVGDWSPRFRFFLDVPTPSQPVVVAPTPNPVGVVIDPTPTIEWQVSVPGNTYDLQLVDVQTNELVINTTGLVGLTYTVPVELQERQYRVRVRSVNTIGETSEWSEYLTFRIDEPNATTPTALGPNGTIRQNDVTFQWQHSPDSIRYEILVRDLRNQSNIVLQVTSFDVDTGLNVASFDHNLVNGTYRFWVRAFNTQNTASGWSNSLSFIVDNPLAQLEGASFDGDLLLTSLDISRAVSVDKTEQQPAVKAAPVVESADPVVVNAPTPSAMDADAFEAVMAEFADPANFATLDPSVSES